MTRSGGTTTLDPELWSQTLYREIPELKTLAHIYPESLFLEDSSNLAPSHWEQLSTHILDLSADYDGFVILHGTDTMAYTASALSYSLAGLGKPVILTGSQVPMSMLRSDAKRNVVNAVELSTLGIPEVGICFHDTLYRGNRATKMSISDFDAFESPNFPPLAEIGLHMEINQENLLHEYSTAQKFKMGVFNSTSSQEALFSNELFILKLFPGLSTDLLMNLPFEKANVIVLEAFGSGNFTIKGETSILPFLVRARELGIHIIMTSQAPFDSIDLHNYESGKIALDLDVISAGDMTIEAAVTKAMFLLAHPEQKTHFKEMFLAPIVGERSTESPRSNKLEKR